MKLVGICSVFHLSAIDLDIMTTHSCYGAALVSVTPGWQRDVFLVSMPSCWRHHVALVSPTPQHDVFLVSMASCWRLHVALVSVTPGWEHDVFLVFMASCWRHHVALASLTPDWGHSVLLASVNTPPRCFHFFRQRMFKRQFLTHFPIKIEFNNETLLCL